MCCIYINKISGGISISIDHTYIYIYICVCVFRIPPPTLVA